MDGNKVSDRAICTQHIFSPFLCSCLASGVRLKCVKYSVLKEIPLRWKAVYSVFALYSKRRDGKRSLQWRQWTWEWLHVIKKLKPTQTNVYWNQTIVNWCISTEKSWGKGNADVISVRVEWTIILRSNTCSAKGVWKLHPNVPDGNSYPH